jgi:hypothetical protein
MTEPQGEPLTLGRALREYVEARSAAMLSARKQLRIGELDARALLFVVDHPAARARDLGDYLGLSSAGTTTLTDRLVSRGVVRRDPDVQDRRVVRLTAVIDIDDEPWSALRGFDDAFAAAIDGGDQAACDDAAELISGFTTSAIPR